MKTTNTLAREYRGITRPRGTLGRFLEVQAFVNAQERGADMANALFIATDSHTFGPWETLEWYEQGLNNDQRFMVKAIMTTRKNLYKEIIRLDIDFVRRELVSI